MTESLEPVLQFEAGWEFRFNGEWLEVVKMGTDRKSLFLWSAGEPGEPDRVFAVNPSDDKLFGPARRRVRKP